MDSKIDIIKYVWTDKAENEKIVKGAKAGKEINLKNVFSKFNTLVENGYIKKDN
jgi:hypothetical protein